MDRGERWWRTGAETATGLSYGGVDVNVCIVWVMCDVLVVSTSLPCGTCSVKKICFLLLHKVEPKIKQSIKNEFLKTNSLKNLSGR